MSKTNKTIITTISGLVGFTISTGLFLSSSITSAESSTSSNASVTIAEACTMSGQGVNSHTAEIANGTYRADIGSTTINVTCNDASGFSIYATGFTGNEIGATNSNKLVGTVASGNATIATGTATTTGNPDVSNWAMKLTAASGTGVNYPLTISTGYNAYHGVPSTWTKVATRLSGTDVGTGAEGSTMTTTYAAYISKTQAADTYTGKVKYTLVHPSNGAAPTVPPTPPASCTTPVPNLTYMQDLNISNKSTVLSNMTEDAQYYLADIRDNKAYCVAKLRDGNIWMTQNLDHDIKTDGSVTYNSTTTDLPANTTWNPMRATYATGTTTWSSYGSGSYGHTQPESYDPGELYWIGLPVTQIPDTEEACTAVGGTWDEWCELDFISATGNSHYHIGNFYNWTAAIAMNDSYDLPLYDEQSGEIISLDVDQSICPAGWTLPKDDDEISPPPDKSFKKLALAYSDEYGLIHDPDIWGSAIKISLADGWNVYTSLGGGGQGNYWTSIINENYTNASNYFYVDYYGEYYDSYVNDRYEGFSVRCVAR